MIKDLPEKWRIDLSMEEYERHLIESDRRLYLMSEIASSDNESGGYALSIASQIVDDIIAYNRLDKDISPGDRKPIRLYINSPGGDVTEGFAIVSAIEASKTPVWTINVGQWSSMAFLIGITGHWRLSLRHAMFLMHDGTTFTFDSMSKAQDKMDFDKRFEQEVVKPHVLSHSKMTAAEYDAKERIEFYMLPEDAKRLGFIDDIVETLDEII